MIRALADRSGDDKVVVASIAPSLADFGQTDGFFPSFMTHTESLTTAYIEGSRYSPTYDPASDMQEVSKVLAVAGRTGTCAIWEELAGCSCVFPDETGAIGRFGNLGKLADRADETLANVIRSRGGGASQLRQLQTGYGERTLGELSDLMARGDREAARAVKMAKQAGSQGRGGK